jgi:hypothetical protein
VRLAEGFEDAVVQPALVESGQGLKPNLLQI